jgi:hypothetical protein
MQNEGSEKGLTLSLFNKNCQLEGRWQRDCFRKNKLDDLIDTMEVPHVRFEK